VDARDRKDAGIKRVLAFGDQRLQVLYKPCGGHDRVAPLMRLGGMGAEASNRPIQFIGSGHHGASYKSKFSNGGIGVDVLSEDHRRHGVLQRSIGDHHAGAAWCEFFPWLEEQLNGAS